MRFPGAESGGSLLVRTLHQVNSSRFHGFPRDVTPMMEVLLHVPPLTDNWIQHASTRKLSLARCIPHLSRIWGIRSSSFYWGSSQIGIQRDYHQFNDTLKNLQSAYQVWVNKLRWSGRSRVGIQGQSGVKMPGWRSRRACELNFLSGHWW